MRGEIDGVHRSPLFIWRKGGTSVLVKPWHISKCLVIVLEQLGNASISALLRRLETFEAGCIAAQQASTK